ncbi:MAG: two-component system sensor histidine kinase NtrB [Alkalispirochaeta sp.]
MRHVSRWLREIVAGTFQPLPIPADTGEDDRELLESLNAAYHNRKQLLEEGRSRYRLIIDSTPIAICITNRKGIYEYVNPQYQKLTGYAAAQLVGQSFLTVVPPDAQAELQHLHDEFMGRHYELEGRWQITTKAGKTIPILASAAYVIDFDGTPKKITFVIDISDLEREAEDRRRAEQMRDEVERVLRHDLRNPLDGIRTAADYLLQEDLDPRAEEFVRLMYEAAVRARAQIDNSLAYTRMQQGTYEVDRERLNIVQLVRDVIRNLRDVCDAYRVEIVATYHGKPLAEQYDIELWGDGGFLMDAVGNLLRNAVEACTAGDVVTVAVDDTCTIETAPAGTIESTGEAESAGETESVARQEPAVSIAIHNGAAIPPEIRDTLFEPYVTHGKSGGTGLGTYTARMVAEAHGGTVKVDTGEEIGTTMTIIVPRRRPGVYL